MDQKYTEIEAVSLGDPALIINLITDLLKIQDAGEEVKNKSCHGRLTTIFEE
jgi:hypothetical protein